MRALVSSSFMAALCAACSADDARVFETDHLRITHTEDLPICQGTLDLLEAETVRVLDVQGLAFEGRLDVLYGEDAAEECEEGTGTGCAYMKDGKPFVAAGETIAIHELTHGARMMVGLLGPAFFEEGLAEVLSGGSYRPYHAVTDITAEDPGPTDLIELGTADLAGRGYDIAANFLSWLRVRLGDEATFGYLTDAAFEYGAETDDVLPAFSDYFGMSLAEAEAMWRSDPLEATTWGSYCEEVLEWDGGGMIEIESRLDCEMPSTQGPPWLSSAWFCFETDAEQNILVEVVGDVGEAFFDYNDCTGMASQEAFQRKYVGAGSEMELPFAACSWRGYYRHGSAWDLEPVDYTIRLTLLGS